MFSLSRGFSPFHLNALCLRDFVGHACLKEIL